MFRRIMTVLLAVLMVAALVAGPMVNPAAASVEKKEQKCAGKEFVDKKTGIGKIMQCQLIQCRKHGKQNGESNADPMRKNAQNAKRKH